MKLAKENFHPRDSRIKFIEASHTYFIDGKKYPLSVTGLIHSFFPKFNACNVIEKMQSSPDWEKSPYYGMSREEIMKLWSEKSKEAMALGTKMHSNIENYYNGIAVDFPEYPYFKNYLNDHPNLVPFRTEWCVYTSAYKIAGSIDMVYIDPKDPKKVILADWKRSKEIKMENKWEKGLGCLSELDNCNYNHYCLQLNMYKIILEKSYGLTVSEMFLVIIHPDNDNYIKINVPDMTDITVRLLQESKSLTK